MRITLVWDDDPQYGHKIDPRTIKPNEGDWTLLWNEDITDKAPHPAWLGEAKMTKVYTILNATKVKEIIFEDGK